MKFSYKRIVPLVLALVLTFCLVPSLIFEAAANDVGSTGVDYTYKNLSSTASFNASLSGNTITATATGVNLGFLGKSTGKGSVTLTNESGSAATLVFTCTVKSGSGSVEVPGDSTIGSGTKTYTKSLAAGESVVITITGPDGGKIVVDITIVSLTVAQSGIPTTFQAPTNGSYTVDGTALTANTTLRKSSTESYAVKATPASGYKFFGWYSTKENGYISHAASTSLTIREETTVYPVFVPTDTPVFGVGGATVTNVPYEISKPLYLYEYSYYKVSPDKQFTDLQEALDYAKSSGNSYVVVMCNATIPARADGSAYSVPSGVTLLIPFESTNKGYHATPYIEQVPNGVNGSNHRPTVYRTMTLAAGAKIEVHGKLEVAADHYISHGGITLGGQPITQYGQIVMGENSSITVKKDGNLYAWGYITGADSAWVIAESGATVYEKMQVSDYGGGSASDKLTGAGIFPFNQYYLQNVEVHEKFVSGSSLICHAGIYGNGVVGYSMNMFGNNDSCMFQLGANSYTTKYYNNGTDRLTIEGSGTFAMNPISIAGQNTGQFVLPFNHNFNIVLKSGTTATSKQDIMMQPGSILTIEEGAEFVVGEGKRFFVIDADNWGIFCYGRYLQQVPFVPRTGTYPNVRQSGESQYPYDSAMVDAKVIVNGTLTVKGSLYTSNGNASIVTENEKGKIQYVSAAPDATTVKESNIVNVDIAYDFFDITMNPAVLTNGNTTYPTLNTAGAAAGTNYNYCADCDRWYTGTHKIQVAFVDHDESSILSGEFCPNTVLTNKVTDPTRAADVQYKSYTFAGWSDGTNVYATNALPNATVDVTYTATYTPGELQIYEITWNINGTATTEEYTYGATPDCKAAITLPTAPDACHYYSFIGWATTEGGAKAYEEDELPTVTGAASYYAVYELVTDSNHNENVFAYVDNGDGETHTKKLACACGKVIDAEEAHDFTNGDCVCGAKKPATGLKGDVNQDGIVDQDDVIALLRHILKADIITDETVLAVSEVTGDTVLDQNDVLKILRYVLKAIDSLD